MNMKRNHLISLIRKLGKLVGEDEKFLKEYEKQQADAWAHDLDAAIKCFRILIYKEETKNEI